MWRFLLVCLVVGSLLLLGEYLWRIRRHPGELTRKFVHISVGTFVAFWPFFLSWNTIKALSLAFIIGILLSRQFHIFRAIHSVTRPTRGELFFALAVGLIAFVTHDKWIYMTALLQMSLADGLAAVVGTYFGRAHSYHLFGHTKSVIGTATFALVSLVSLIIYTHVGSVQLALLPILGLSLTATAIENVAPQGLDNLFVPLLIAMGLRLLG